ncbi:hypothetical protein PHYPSEUDO_014441 [Phytophthora pseudosyringae]|uniref:Uncharacterized protein n=1 Tax=Phytophthora pseudosyringae TaxID=221518 RepID=A0A8T1V500_9STRA|nr:hypothetical protein PHYPSEUDO_014441 [Phytophthora pseudosyringae]
MAVPVNLAVFGKFTRRSWEFSIMFDDRHGQGPSLREGRGRLDESRRGTDFFEGEAELMAFGRRSGLLDIPA